MTQCEFRYGNTILRLSVPDVPRKDESILMPDGVRYRVAFVRWHLEYDETTKADLHKKHIDRDRPKDTWTISDGKINAIVFLEK